MKLLNRYLLATLFMSAGVVCAWDNVVTPWQRLDGCAIKDSYGNDGDSFHVLHGDKEYVFRICFADCPESSASYPKRVHEQAEWWGISDEDVVKAGHDATKFTMDLFKANTFTVYTKFKDARGQSRLGREFAMIKIDGRYLSERLVEAGLARSYGYALATPDGTSRNDYRKRLDRLEKKAKREGRGAWGYAAKNKKASVGSGKGAGADSAVESIVLREPVAFYSAGAGASFRGTLKVGTKIYILDKSGREMIKVKAPFHGSMSEGQCQRWDLRKVLK